MNSVAPESPAALVPYTGNAYRWWRRLAPAAWYAMAVLIIAVGLLTWCSLHLWTPLTQAQQWTQTQAATDLAQARGWVWVNTNSGTYHYPGMRWYGNTGDGKYLPEWLVQIEGYRAAGNGQ